MLTRFEMETVIRGGGSVSHNGRIITRVEDLPSAASLAVGDPIAEATAREDLQRQIEALSAQLAQLRPAEPEASAQSETTAPASSAKK